MDQWATHLPALIACASSTKGPILECGVGIWSTPILHALCAPTSRTLVSLEANPEWLARFAHLVGPVHELRQIESWNDIPAGPWSVAFVDHGAAPRGPVVAALRGRADLVVMHDSECGYCEYTDALRSFDWCWTHQFSPAWTTVAGMDEPPPWIATALQPGTWGAPRPYR